jgi:hypothetical protein
MSSFKLETKPKSAKPVIADCLSEDRPIAGQKFACMSFICPRQLLKKKDVFYFESFLKTWEFNKSIEVFIQFLNFAAFKYKLTIDDIMTDFQEFVKSEKIELVKSDVEGDFATFMENNYKRLDDEFSILHNFETHTPGVKIRGVYATQEEAAMRAKVVRDLDIAHAVHVCPVGVWAPIAPEEYKLGNTEHLIPELNELMHEKEKSDANAKMEFDKRILDTKRAAVEENVKAAKKSGNVLTQTINDQGNLVGIGNTTSEAALNAVREKHDEHADGEETVSTKQIQSELFESSNIIIGDTDHGKSLLKGENPFNDK